MSRQPDGTPAKEELVSTSHGPGGPGGPDGGKDHFEVALNHVTTIYGQYIGQRQNLVNYYLAGIALISVAYAAALDKHRPVAVAVAILGAIASVVAVVQDGELKIYMETAEDALAYLQEFLVKERPDEKLDRKVAVTPRKPEEKLEILRIQKLVEKRKSLRSTREKLIPSGKSFSRGTTIRVIYLCIAIAFTVGAVYAIPWDIHLTGLATTRGVNFSEVPRHLGADIVLACSGEEPGPGLSISAAMHRATP